MIFPTQRIAANPRIPAAAAPTAMTAPVAWLATPPVLELVDCGVAVVYKIVSLDACETMYEENRIAHSGLCAGR